MDGTSAPSGASPKLPLHGVFNGVSHPFSSRSCWQLNYFWCVPPPPSPPNFVVSMYGPPRTSWRGKLFFFIFSLPPSPPLLPQAVAIIMPSIKEALFLPSPVPPAVAHLQPERGSHQPPISKSAQFRREVAQIPGALRRRLVHAAAAADARQQEQRQEHGTVDFACAANMFYAQWMLRINR